MKKKNYIAIILLFRKQECNSVLYNDVYLICAFLIRIEKLLKRDMQNKTASFFFLTSLVILKTRDTFHVLVLRVYKPPVFIKWYSLQ